MPAPALILPCGFTISTGRLNRQCASAASCGESSGNYMKPKENTAVAVRYLDVLDPEGFPGSPAWNAAPAYQFDADWQGKNADPQRGTAVQLLWTPGTLFLRFTARYRNITVFPDSDADGRRYQLWD